MSRKQEVACFHCSQTLDPVSFRLTLAKRHPTPEPGARSRRLDSVSPGGLSKEVFKPQKRRRRACKPPTRRTRLGSRFS